MKPDGFWQRMASAGERPGNLKRFGAESFLSKLAESIPSSSGTLATGNFFNATKTPPGVEGASKRTTGTPFREETEGWNPLETDIEFGKLGPVIGRIQVNALGCKLKSRCVLKQTS
jgi:hypothetical protein